MKWLKENWSKTPEYILKGFLLYLCGGMLYLWLSFNGSIGEKLFYLILTIGLITVLLVDFLDDIIKWFKRISKL